MRNPIVILHGWSDNSSSFKALANFLQESFGNAVQPLYLADWLLMHDDISYADFYVMCIPIVRIRRVALFISI